MPAAGLPLRPRVGCVGERLEGGWSVEGVAGIVEAAGGAIGPVAVPPAGAIFWRAALMDCCCVLEVLKGLLDAVHARLDLVDGVVEGADLAGDLVDFAAGGVGLGAHAFLQGVDGEGQLVDGVGALLDEVLEDAHALVVGLLEAGYGVLQVLHLGLQLDHVLVDGEGGAGGKGRAKGEDGSEGGVTDRALGQEAHYCVPLRRRLDVNSPVTPPSPLERDKC